MLEAHEVLSQQGVNVRSVPRQTLGPGSSPGLEKRIYMIDMLGALSILVLILHDCTTLHDFDSTCAQVSMPCLELFKMQPQAKSDKLWLVMASASHLAYFAGPVAGLH